MKFIKQLFTTVIAVFIAFGAFLFFLIFFVGVFALQFDTENTVKKVREKTLLSLDISGTIPDYGGTYNFEDINFSHKNHNGLNSIIKAIKYAKTDDNILGIVVPSVSFKAGIPQIKAIRNALEDFKTSKKFVYAYGTQMGQKEYYLKSVADSIFLHPLGKIDFRGLSASMLYLKDFQDKYGIKMEVIRHGKYKSAVEPFLANKMSDENRNQLSELLMSIWDSFAADISKSKNISVETLNSIADNLDARTADLAMRNKLVEGLFYRDEYEAFLKKKTHIDEDEKLHITNIEDYAKNVDIKSRGYSYKNKIAVLYAQGEIRNGKGNNTTIGEDLMIKSLRKAVENEDVKGIVLRIDSPGGNAFVSDVIWREIEVTKKKKPVYVSMGNLAASGGYYIACNANRIFAEKATITGSIGVFGVLPNAKKFTDKIGIYAQHVSTHKNSFFYSTIDTFPKSSKKIITEELEETYKTFLKRVSDGRNLPITEVDKIAKGRVWSGSDALKNKLIDEIGSLDDAITGLAKHLKLESKTYSVVNYPEYSLEIEDFLDEFINFGAMKKTVFKSPFIFKFEKEMEQLDRLFDKKGIHALIPFDINID